MKDHRSSQAARLVRELAALPGGMAMNVVVKKFPRLGPAEAGTGYEEQERSFDCCALPEELSLPHGSDEIIITLMGVMNSPDMAEVVRSRVRSLLATPDLSNYWDSRAKFGKQDDSFCVTVFTEAVFGARVS